MKQAAISIAGALVGPMFGLFLLGVLCPFANAFGVLCGLFTGEFFGIWLLIGSLTFPKKPQMLPTDIDQCPANATTFATSMFMSGPTVTPLNTDDPDRTGILYFYHIAFLLVPVFGCLISLVVGFICSLLSGGTKTAQKVRPQYLSKAAWLIWPAHLLPEKSCNIDSIEYGTNGTSVTGKGEINGNKIKNNNNNIKPSDIQLTQSNSPLPKKITNDNSRLSALGNPHFDNVKRSRIIKQNAFDDDTGDDGDEKTKILAYRAYSPETETSLTTDASPQPLTNDSRDFSPATTISGPSTSDSRSTPYSSSSSISPSSPETVRKS